MSVSALLMLVALGANAAPDGIVKTRVGKLSVNLPVAPDWKSESPSEPEGESRSVSTTDGQAQIDLSVFPVDPHRSAKLCAEQLVKALGGEGFESVTVAKNPAYRKVTVDYLGEDDDAKNDEANKVNTVSYVGCNGKTKWVLSMTSKASKVARFGALLKRVVTSIQYVEKP